MVKLPAFLKQGEPARLFPILADTSKEGRATSILLSCMSKVDEFAAAQINDQLKGTKGYWALNEARFR